MILMAGNEDGLTGLWFEGQKYFGDTLPEKYEILSDPKELAVFAETVCWLDQYFSGQIPGVLPRLSLNASPFRLIVWNILLEIPYGQIMTYGEIAAKAAEQMGCPGMSAQAVGGAVGHNPISVIIPCHRVLGAGRKLTGYAGGVDKKRKLLEIEGIKYKIDQEN